MVSLPVISLHLRMPHNGLRLCHVSTDQDCMPVNHYCTCWNCHVVFSPLPLFISHAAWVRICLLLHTFSTVPWWIILAGGVMVLIPPHYFLFYIDNWRSHLECVQNLWMSWCYTVCYLLVILSAQWPLKLPGGCRWRFPAGSIHETVWSCLSFFLLMVFTLTFFFFYALGQCP